MRKIRYFIILVNFVKNNVSRDCIEIFILVNYNIKDCDNCNVEI